MTCLDKDSDLVEEDSFVPNQSQSHVQPPYALRLAGDPNQPHPCTWSNFILSQEQGFKTLVHNTRADQSDAFQSSAVIQALQNKKVHPSPQRRQVRTP